jgi:hypothetical protein
MAKPPTFLEQLEFVPLTRRTADGDPKLLGRQNVIGGIQKQIDHLNGDVPKPTTFTRTREDGTEREVIRKFTPWYTETSNVFMTEIKYGQMALFKDKDGKPLAVKAGRNPTEVIRFYDDMKQAVARGEFDEAIEKAQEFLANARLNPKPKKPKKSRAKPANDQTQQEAAE